MTVNIPIEVKQIASGYFARCDGIETCFPKLRCNFRSHGHFPGAVFFAPYGFSWKDSFASERSAVMSLCRFLSASTGAICWPKKIEPGFWFILGMSQQTDPDHFADVSEMVPSEILTPNS